MTAIDAQGETIETLKKVQPDKFTQQQMIDALTVTKGMRTKAAKKLRCSYNTVVRYINDYPAVAEAEKIARETMLDAVELKAYSQAMKGDTTMIIFMLKTQGKSRGYVERTEHTGAEGKPFSLEIKTIDYRAIIPPPTEDGSIPDSNTPS